MNQTIPQISIDLNRPEPLAQQIVDGIRVLLIRGTLRPGDLLPSSRRLARELAVHFNTVAAAYRQLEAEGWLALRRKRGTVVLERETPSVRNKQHEALRTDFIEDLARLLARYVAQGLSEADVNEALEQELAGRKS